MSIEADPAAKADVKLINEKNNNNKNNTNMRHSNNQEQLNRLDIGT